MEKNEIKSEEATNLIEKKEIESKENESKPIEKLDEKINIFLFISMLLMKNQRNIKYIYLKNIKVSTHLKKLRKRN